MAVLSNFIFISVQKLCELAPTKLLISGSANMDVVVTGVFLPVYTEVLKLNLSPIEFAPVCKMFIESSKIVLPNVLPF